MESIALVIANYQSVYFIPIIRRETAIVKIEPLQIAVNNIKNELFKYIKLYIAYFL